MMHIVFASPVSGSDVMRSFTSAALFLLVLERRLLEIVSDVSLGTVGLGSSLLGFELLEFLLGLLNILCHEYMLAVCIQLTTGSTMTSW